jgi:hypothetical protein
VLRAPVALRVVQVAQVALRVVQVDLARLVPVVRVALVQVSVAVLAQVSVVLALALALVVQVLLALVASVVLVRVPVAVVAAEEQQVPSVRVAHVAHPRPASRSVRNAKSLNREWLRASEAQLCLVATEPPSFEYVVEQASRTSPTRLMPMPVS